MLFQYIGDEQDSPKSTVAFGYHFFLNGEPVDVTNHLAISKLKNNRCFKHNPDETEDKSIESKLDTGVSYSDMRTFIIESGIKLKSLKKEDVINQYNELKAGE